MLDFWNYLLDYLLSISHSIGNNLLTGFSRDVFAFLQPHTERERNGTEQATVFLLVASVSRRRRRCRRYTCRSLSLRSPFSASLRSFARFFRYARLYACVCWPGRAGAGLRVGSGVPSAFGIVFSYMRCMRARKKGKKGAPPSVNHRKYTKCIPCLFLPKQQRTRVRERGRAVTRRESARAQTHLSLTLSRILLLLINIFVCKVTYACYRIRSITDKWWVWFKCVNFLYFIHPFTQMS